MSAIIGTDVIAFDPGFDYDSNYYSVPSVELISDNNDICLSEGIKVSEATEAGQLHGSALDVLCEIAGRTCYDSFGKGRDSVSYHRHLRDVKHGSVHEHAHIQVIVRDQPAPEIYALPGVLVSKIDSGYEIDANLRAVYENQPILDMAFDEAKRLAPLCMGEPYREEPGRSPGTRTWLTWIIKCSRGCTHELVRHRRETAFSQRSTRYVDESKSNYVLHPLHGPIMHANAIISARRAYIAKVEELETELSKTVELRLQARKQARGAARGYLGNGLETQLCMTTNLEQLDRIVAQRCTSAADAEIRFVVTAMRETAIKGMKR